MSVREQIENERLRDARNLIRFFTESGFQSHASGATEVYAIMRGMTRDEAEQDISDLEGPDLENECYG